MRVRHLHRWDLTPREAADVQRRLAGRVLSRPALRSFSLVAGADVSFHKTARKVYAGVVVCRGDTLEVVERTGVALPESFPYVPGLLSFREAPAVLQCFEKLTLEPDVILFDGQGLAHPRRFGLASHLGLLLNRPSIGCAKSRLIGEYREPGRRRGCRSQLRAGRETIGIVLRTQTGIKPVYVSVGHRIDLGSAVAVVLRCARKYRLPEPTRQAHLYVNQLRREDGGVC
ncbi:MAG: deoxyribonuclease V [Planctomycetes bacterium]|nr:deoxyribonuclease V [Planctomycetota bacterium]